VEELKLVKPSEEYQGSIIAAIEEFKTEGSGSLSRYYNLSGTFVEYIKELLSRPGRKTDIIVPETILWGVVDNDFIGRISIRHELTEYLAKVGGHIGYEVRPSFRSLGHGTKMLKLALPEAKKIGLNRILLTCDETNTGSIKIIKANGGEYSDSVDMGEGKPKKQRYWIEL